MTVDLEDWFCVHNFSNIIKKEDWDKCELRIFESTNRILNLFNKYNVHSTFFVLGYIAEKLPELIRQIDKEGHEIAVHGYAHLLITKTTPVEFENDLVKALESLKNCSIKQSILGFRAPSFTIVKETIWTLKILEKYNIKYDSSIFPFGYHPDYGISDSPLTPYKITENLYEFPLSCIEFSGKRFPCSGGGYFRILPYSYTKYCVKRCNNETRPFIFYIHPWELDSEQPKLNLPLTKKFRHYYNLDKTEKKLEKLLSDFKFTTIKNILKLDFT